VRILINGLAVFRGGSKTYFLNIIPHLGRLAEQHEFVLLHSHWQEMLNFVLPPNFTRIVVGPKRRSVPLRVLWEQTRLPGLLRRERIDVMFSPVPSTTLFSPCPTVIAVRDLNVFSTLSLKDWRYLARNWTLRALTRQVAKRASFLIFVSEYSRDAALGMLGVDPGKAVVIYHGTGAQFFEPAKRPPSELFSGPRPYLLTVSTVQTHKNYPRMIEAFARLCHNPDLGYDYVFAGADSSQAEFQRVQQRINQLNLKGRVHYLGQVPYQDLPALYQGASLFVLPSLLETFGHPLVEAMASGIPIVASNVTCMPEVCEDAAVYFNPYEVDDMVNVLRLVLEDNALRERLVAAGRQRVKNCSWTTTARQLVDLIEAATNED